MNTISGEATRRRHAPAPPQEPKPARALAIHARRQGRWAVLSLDGVLDLVTAPALVHAVTRLFALLNAQGTALALALDLRRLRFCDSSGLNALVRIWRITTAARGELVILDPAPQPARVLRTTGLDRRLDIRPALP
ncbi:STAS domain-containing protein [Spirillospora sp. NPDC029432]|uniref:STAS domain-containing protein n=1 Tax=Spirillospora sp. NPDC029432 TaxID=3154599 RepID=UPI0034534E8C